MSRASAHFGPIRALMHATAFIAGERSSRAPTSCRKHGGGLALAQRADPLSSGVIAPALPVVVESGQRALQGHGIAKHVEIQVEHGALQSLHAGHAIEFQRLLAWAQARLACALDLAFGPSPSLLGTSCRRRAGPQARRQGPGRVHVAAAGQVRESKSPHSSPTFCVKKANGS